MGNYQFSKDIVIGDKGERILIKFLEDNYGGVFVSKSEKDDLKKWDLGFHFPYYNKNVTYEVKTDVFVTKDKRLDNGFLAKGNDTGNIFIEYYSRGKDSGINVTESNVWVNIFYNLKEIWFIQTEKLKELINNNDFEKTIDSGDLGSDTRGYLIPREKYREHFLVKKFK